MIEADLMVLLHARLGQEGGNGPAHALVHQVRNAAGFDARRTIDAISMGLWPSRGLTLTGYELKCSRSDWLRELKNPEKAEQFTVALDFFYIVASKDVVRDGELPPGWGLLVAQKNRLVRITDALALRDLTPDPNTRQTPLPDGFTRSFLASMLRACVRQHDATPEEVAEATRTAVSEARATFDRDHRFNREGYEAQKQMIRDFEKASGVSLQRWSIDGDPATVGRGAEVGARGADGVRATR